MNEKQRLQLLYQKNDFNYSRICILSNIFICKKCRKNNSIISSKILTQKCCFCGHPNFTTKQ